MKLSIDLMGTIFSGKLQHYRTRVIQHEKFYPTQYYQNSVFCT